MGAAESGQPPRDDGFGLAVDDQDRPIVTWSTAYTTDAEIHLRAWNGSAWTDIQGSASGGGISNSPAHSASPAIVLTADLVCVGWAEPADGRNAGVLRCAHR